MRKFMVLYMASPESFAKMMRESTPEQQQQGMKAWMAWMDKHRNEIIDGGGPLAKTKRVDTKGASDTKNSLGGYSIVQANSHDDAVKLFGSDHPHLQMPGSWIEITEIVPIPGM